MEAINSWVNCILAVIILVGIIEVIVPEGETRKFVFLVTGVITAVVIATPIIKFFSGDFSLKDVFDEEIIDNNFYYTDTWRSTAKRQAEVLEEVFADNAVRRFNSMYFDMKISECKISFSHDVNGKIIEVKEVSVKCEGSVDDVRLLKQRVADVCEVEVEKVRVS